MIRRLPLLALLLTIGLVQAADNAARLEADLTPMGAKRAGNADGSIPAWDGGLTPDRAPASYTPGSRYIDPFSAEAPLFTIDKTNLSTYESKLTPGQQALFAALPETFAMPVYSTHRSAAAPTAFYVGTRSNAATAQLAENGSPKDVVAGLPFPVLGTNLGAEPEDGLRLFWNQRLRWRGVSRDRTYSQASVSPGGVVSRVRFRERTLFRSMDAMPSKAIGAVLSANLIAVLEPTRLAGSLKLVHETLTPPYPAWQRSLGPEVPLLSKTTEAGNDSPALAAEGLLDEDQREGYTGGPERYLWKLAGTREIFVPYNAYRLHEAGLTPADLLTARHLNPAHLRYELHRVRVLDARLKPSLPGIWPRRTFYIDEDSSQILLVDLYGQDDRIQRVQEIHTLMAYDQTLLLPAVETVFDLVGRRYLATGLDNNEREAGFAAIDDDEFTPDRAKRRWRLNSSTPPAK